MTPRIRATCLASGHHSGTSKPDFWLGPRTSGEGFRECHIAFAAPSRAKVEAFFEAAVGTGAEVLHEPRTRPDYHPGYYGAFVRDPDGNNVEAVCQVDSRRVPACGHLRLEQAWNQDPAGIDHSVHRASITEAGVIAHRSSFGEGGPPPTAPAGSMVVASRAYRGWVKPADEDVDLETLLDLTSPWCLRVVATLRIVDHIAAGLGQVDDLAAAAGCDAEALHNVLAHLVSKGVFREETTGRFALNRAAEGLRDQSPFLDLEGIDGRFAHAWGTLLSYVRTGAPGYHEVFGRPFWEDLEANPKLSATFDAMMGPSGHSVPDYDIELTGGWGAIRTVVDVGGGTGAMLAELLCRHGKVHGTLVDLPGTVARSAKILEAAGVAERITTVGQSFFDPLPAGADLYLLRKVLNDWPDRETVAILRRCAEAVRPNGRIVILGGVSPEDAPRSLTIEMVLLGGKTNTITDFRDLAREAGLRVTAAGQQPSRHFVVECRPI